VAPSISARAVRSVGGRSVVALPSTTPKGRPRIVPRVDHVSALGSDVDVIATEHGVAEIHGLTSGQRAERIIEIAAPSSASRCAKLRPTRDSDEFG